MSTFRENTIHYSGTAFCDSQDIFKSSSLSRQKEKVRKKCDGQMNEHGRWVLGCVFSSLLVFLPYEGSSGTAPLARPLVPLTVALPARCMWKTKLEKVAQPFPLLFLFKVSCLQVRVPLALAPLRRGRQVCLILGFSLCLRPKPYSPGSVSMINNRNILAPHQLFHLCLEGQFIQHPTLWKEDYVTLVGQNDRLN